MSSRRLFCKNLLLPPLASLSGCQWLDAFRGRSAPAVNTLLSTAANADQGHMIESSGPAQKIGFASLPMRPGTGIDVPPGYRVQMLCAWGDPIGLPQGMPDFKLDGSNSSLEQSMQAGMHHDGMAYFSFPDASDGKSTRALLAINHEYVDKALLIPSLRTADERQLWSKAEQVAKSKAAHGVSIIEVAQHGKDGAWRMVRPSGWARRIHADTPMHIQGPARGHRWMKTLADPQGVLVLGTFANCGSGPTPWQTYLTCEENFANYFHGGESLKEGIRRHHDRWGAIGKGKGIDWHEIDERFDLDREPHEANRFGWVVEIDPFDPKSVPIKRTALGRAAHEGATTVIAPSGQAVVYMGEDARFEYIYKFVSRDPVQPGGGRANRTLLDHGTLYVAKFHDDGRGEWLPMVHGEMGLVADNGFHDQGDVLIQSRQAADLLGATKMDRPEWITVDAMSGHVYCALTNNIDRGRLGFPAADAANPRGLNVGGHIIRWRPVKANGLVDHAARTFKWEIFLLGQPGERDHPDFANFGSPDGLWLDPRGLLWIQTDTASPVMGKGPYRELVRNQVLLCDPATGQRRRFLVAPPGAEVAGLCASPDLRSLFVNIQHPGEGLFSTTDVLASRFPTSWPAETTEFNQRPRSATIVITREDGGIIGD